MQTNEFDNYVFIYKDSYGRWGDCKNPQFIARHTCCRAIPISGMTVLWGNLKDFLNYLQESRFEDIEISEEQQKFLQDYVW